MRGRNPGRMRPGCFRGWWAVLSRFHVSLEPLDPGRQRLAVDGGLGSGQADQGEFDDEPFLTALTEVEQCLAKRSMARSTSPATIPGVSSPLVEDLE